MLLLELKFYNSAITHMLELVGLRLLKTHDIRAQLTERFLVGWSNYHKLNFRDVDWRQRRVKYILGTKDVS